jgi:DNA gyrase subunit B
MGVSNSGGLHGVGASVVNALSSWVKVTIKRDGCVWLREYNEGVPTATSLANTGSCPKKETGTTVQFMPDKKYFRDAVFDDVRVRRRLRELSFLNPGLKIDLKWSDGATDSFHSEGGLKEYVSYLLGKKTKLCEPVCFTEKTDQFEAFCAFVYDSGFDETTLSFANNINTVEGGVHLNAALDSLCKELTTVADNAGLFKNLGDLKPLKSDVCEGLTLVVSVRVPEPSFGGQTKTKLANDELRKSMGDWFAGKFSEIFAKDKSIAKAIAAKLVDSMKARDAARKAKNLSRKKSVLESLSLPGKLSDCSSKDPTLNELFIVEGDSAGGTAIMSRNRTFQAVLPLRGKVLNVQKTTLNKALGNNEIASLIAALGVGVTEREAYIDDLRYHKVIIATDADQDGGHILCLLLSFFFRYMKKMIEEGHVYICEPPLYRVRIGSDSRYLKNDDALIEFREKNEGKKIEVSRFKGLGEMDVTEFAETAMEPSSRNIRRVYMEDECAVALMLNTLMGDGKENLDARKEFLSKRLSFGDSE